jgi:hypothetical protein
VSTGFISGIRICPDWHTNWKVSTLALACTRGDKLTGLKDDNLDIGLGHGDVNATEDGDWVDAMHCIEDPAM